jgi:riboflavin biosynthesis pyrimidine reductase
VSAARFRWLLPEAGGTVTAAELAASLGLREKASEDRPAVALNMIASLDGRIALAGRTGPLANQADHELFHALRGAADAVLVGAGTVRAEGYGAMDQLAVVVSNSLRLAPDLGLLHAPGNRVVVVTESDGELAPSAAEVTYLRISPMDLGEALRRLRVEHDVRAAVCEGGAHLNAALLPAGLVDELHLVLSPLLVGGEDPLTLIAGSALEPPLHAELAWLLESSGYLFTRYRVGTNPQRREGQTHDAHT